MKPTAAGSAVQALVALGTFLVVFTAAEAAFPGANGKIVFASNPSGNFDLFTMNPDGSGLAALTSDPAEEFEAAWSPDGSKIAFVSDRDGLPALYVMNADGSGTTRITEGPDFSPAWSPDGTRIAFSRFVEATGDFEIWVANADGTAPVNLTNSPKDDMEPSWSPDGTKIAFSSNRTRDWEVFVMGADGSGPTNLTSFPGSDRDPDWSPDGTRIAFTSLRSGRSGIWVMNADGSGQSELSGLGDIGPAFSPDGTKIVFSSDRDGNLELYVMGADGADPERLTADDPASPRDDVLAAWQAIAPSGENRPPVAAASGPGQPVECGSPSGGLVRLDGSGSSDPDSTPGTNDDIVSFEWFEDFGTADERFLGAGETIEVELPVGLHRVALRVTDREGLSDTDSIEVSVVDTVAPSIVVRLVPSLLWPPDHRMVPVHAVVEASDACGEVTVVLAAVESSEPEHAAGSGHTAPDIAGAELGTADFDVELRAERAGPGSGRVYTLVYRAVDGAGHGSEAAGTARVPHDRGKGGGGSGEPSVARPLPPVPPRRSR
jgi:TolB protein